jgi:hypothetical protein
MNAGTPERFVRVDVPHPGEQALVEQRSLDRRAPLLQSLREPARRESSSEQLAADPRREIRLELVRLDEEPRAEPAYVAIDDIRSVV